jgi:hypothetical protein
MTLKRARERWVEARRQLLEGVDPGANNKMARALQIEAMLKRGPVTVTGRAARVPKQGA